MASESPRRLSPLARVYVAMAIYTAVFSFLCIQRWLTAYYGDPDYGLFLQCFWTTTHKGWLLYNTYEGGTHFQTHNSPVFLLVLPFYALLPRMETLLVVQAAAVALGALGVFRLAAMLLDEDAAVTFAYAWLLYHPLHGVNYDQFNELSFLPTPLLFAFYNLYRRQMGWFWTCIFLALGCKEDVPFVTFMLGIYTTWLGWREGRRTGTSDPLVKHGVLLMLVSAAWLLLSLLVLFPLLRGGADWPYFRERYGQIGNSFTEVATTILLRPWVVLPYLASKQAVLVFLELTLPLALLPLAAPSVLAIVAPTWVILWLSSFGAMHNCGSRYMAPIVACMFVAAIVGLRQGLTGGALTLDASPLEADLRLRAGKRARLVVVLCVLFSLAISQTPIRFPFKRIPILSPHQRARNELASHVPPDASVSTQPELYGKVAGRAEAYIGYHPGTEYILVDPTLDYTGHATWYDHAKWDVNLPLLLQRGEYKVIEEADGALLLEKRH